MNKNDLKQLTRKKVVQQKEQLGKKKRKETLEILETWSKRSARAASTCGKKNHSGDLKDVHIAGKSYITAEFEAEETEHPRDLSLGKVWHQEHSGECGSSPYSLKMHQRWRQETDHRTAYAMIKDFLYSEIKQWNWKHRHFSIGSWSYKYPLKK